MRRLVSKVVMHGLDPGIHARAAVRKKNVDGRDPSPPRLRHDLECARRAEALAKAASPAMTRLLCPTPPPAADPDRAAPGSRAAPGPRSNSARGLRGWRQRTRGPAARC